MDAKEIIQDEADRFCHKKLYEYGGLDGEHMLFKNDLQMKLDDYDEPVDKLIFLYRVSLKIDNERKKYPTNVPVYVVYSKIKY